MRFARPALAIALVALAGCSSPSSGDVSTTSAAVTTAASLKVTGDCRLEQANETITLSTLDPAQHFGMFAAGDSARGDRVYLTTNFGQGRIDARLNGVGGSAYGIYEPNASGVVVIKIGATVQGSKGTDSSDWFSCELTVGGH